jgi:hypothetical protein
MSYEPRLITPFTNSGLSKFFKPYIIGNTAFPVIEDAYSWRGSVRKREGFQLFTTLPNSDFPVQGLKNFINPSTLNPNLIAFSLTKSYGYIGTSFTDITQLTDGSTTFSFGTGQFNYYWTSNFAGSMWTTNGLGYVTSGLPTAVNGILYLTANAPNSWNIHTPLISGTTYLNGGLIVLPYKGRLVVLNTIEGNQTGTTKQSFSNRARWAQLGTPYVPTYNKGASSTGNTSPPTPFSTDANAWRSDIPGKGGFIDADTSERIVSATIIKDTLIVGFQRSTWRLRYTGNEILPFVWERLNTQFGAESTFSAIPFDEHALFFSRYGWIGSDTNDVQRIDLDIPDDSFSFETGDSTFDYLATMQGIRDFYRQFAYWTFTPIEGDINSQIYAYNYIDKSWSIYNPSVPINCFGEFYNTSDFTWASFNNAGSGVDDPTSDRWIFFDSPDDTWNNFGSSQQLGFPFIVGGDFSGNIYEMFEFKKPAVSDDGTLFNFTIATKRFNPYFEQGLKCRLGYVDLYCSTNVYGEITVQHFVNDQAAPVFTRTLALYPRGVLTVSSVTIGSTTSITTSIPHNLINNQNVTLSGFYGTVSKALNNEITPVTVTSTTSFTIPIDTSSLIYTAGGFIWSPVFDAGSATYTRIYLGAIAHMHQLIFTLSPQQLADPVKGTAQFEMQGLVTWTKPCGRIRG